MDIYIYVIPYYIIEMVNIPTFIFKQSMKLVKCHDGDFICQHVAKSLWTLFRTKMLLRKKKKKRKTLTLSRGVVLFSRRVGMGMSSNIGVCLKMTQKTSCWSFYHHFPIFSQNHFGEPEMFGHLGMIHDDSPCRSSFQWWKTVRWSNSSR